MTEKHFALLLFMHILFYITYFCLASWGVMILFSIEKKRKQMSEKGNPGLLHSVDGVHARRGYLVKSAIFFLVIKFDVSRLLRHELSTNIGSKMRNRIKPVFYFCFQFSEKISKLSLVFIAFAHNPHLKFFQMLEASLYISEHLPDGTKGLWGLVHCASWMALGELEWIPFAVLRKSIDINLLGSLLRLT